MPRSRLSSLSSRRDVSGGKAIDEVQQAVLELCQTKRNGLGTGVRYVTTALHCTHEILVHLHLISLRDENDWRRC